VAAATRRVPKPQSHATGVQGHAPNPGFKKKAICHLTSSIMRCPLFTYQKRVLWVKHPHYIYMHPFDQIVKPVLLYGSKVWGDW